MAINREKSSLRLNRFASTVQNNRGFTLVELIVVTAIIGVLASTALITISDFKDKTKAARCTAEIRGLEKDIISYASEKGTFPANANVPEMANLKNLLDPWGNTYVYTFNPIRTSIGTPINTDFDLYSKGVDGNSNASIEIGTGIDDIIRAGDGSFVGPSDKWL